MGDLAPDLAVWFTSGLGAGRTVKARCPLWRDKALRCSRPGQVMCSVRSEFFATHWVAALQAPLSMEFSSKNTGVGCHFLLQGIFLTQGLKLCCLHWQADSLSLSHLGSPHHSRRYLLKTSS